MCFIKIKLQSDLKSIFDYSSSAHFIEERWFSNTVSKKIYHNRAIKCLFSLIMNGMLIICSSKYYFSQGNLFLSLNVT